MGQRLQTLDVVCCLPSVLSVDQEEYLKSACHVGRSVQALPQQRKEIAHSASKERELLVQQAEPRLEHWLSTPCIRLAEISIRPLNCKGCIPTRVKSMPTYPDG